MSGIDRVIHKAARDVSFLGQLAGGREPRREVAKYAGIDLTDIEAQLLEAVSKEHLLKMVIAIRPQFTDEQLKCIPLGIGGTCTLDVSHSKGIRPDKPGQDTRFGGIRPDHPRSTK